MPTILINTTPPAMLALVKRNEEICDLRDRGCSSSEIIKIIGGQYNMGTNPLATVERIAFGRTS